MSLCNVSEGVSTNLICLDETTQRSVDYLSNAERNFQSRLMMRSSVTLPFPNTGLVQGVLSEQVTRTTLTLDSNCEFESHSNVCEASDVYADEQVDNFDACFESFRKRLQPGEQDWVLRWCHIFFVALCVLRDHSQRNFYTVQVQQYFCRQAFE